MVDGIDDIADHTDPVTSKRGRPKPDFTSEELEALAASPDVMARNAPFAPAPAPRRSRYVTVSDGTRLALSFYFPDGFDESSGKAPIAYIEGWYPRRKEAEGEALDHQADPTAAQFAEVVYRDDLLGAGSVAQMSAVGHIEELRRAALPARVSASWLDGSTAESALRRFTALPDVPMEVFIGAHTHSSGLHADPFERTPFQSARPTAAEQSFRPGRGRRTEPIDSSPTVARRGDVARRGARR